MAFTEDFSLFFDTAGFGVPFTYTPKAGREIKATGIFDNAHYAAEGGEVSVSSSQPQLIFESVKIPSPTYGETITVNGRQYTIVGIHPDGTGTTTLILEEQDDGTC